MKKFDVQTLDVLDAAIKKFGNAKKLSAASGVAAPNISRWQNRGRKPQLSEIAPIIDLMGGKIILEGDESPSRNVCFVNAITMPTVDNVKFPVPEDYIAAPLVGEVGAGPGYLPEEKIKSWFLAYKHLPAIQQRRNLIAVEIGKNSTSMQPTLNPGDIVLIDRDDKNVSETTGRIMLVLDPVDGSGMVKRVNVKEGKKDWQITYYSDNVVYNPPQVYSLVKDFDGEWERAIVGAAIWAWADIRNK